MIVRARNCANSFRRTVRSRSSNARNALVGELRTDEVSGRLIAAVAVASLIRAGPSRSG